MTRRIVWCLWCAALVTFVASAEPFAQSFTKEELATHPYFLMHGQRPQPERVARLAALAAIAEKDHDLPRAARLYALHCGVAAGYQGEAALNSSSCDRAAALADAHDLVDVKVQLKNNRGSLQAWSFNFTGAMATLTEAIAMGDGLDLKSPDSLPVITSHHLLGSTSIEAGHFDVAQKELTMARDHCRAIGHAQCAGFADAHLCRLHTMLGDFPAARSACEAATAEAAVDNDILLQANIGWQRGGLEAQTGHPQESLAALEAAWRATLTSGVDVLKPVLAQQMVDALMRTGRISEAAEWQARIEKGLGDGSIPPFFGPQIAYRRGVIASAQFRMNDAEAAYLAASRSLIHEMSIRGFVRAARVNRIRGRNARASELLEQAIGKIESARTSVGGAALRASYLTMHWNAYRELIGVRWALDGDRAGPAILELAEAGRARALLDALASSQVAGATAPTLTAGAVQQMLGPDDVLIEYVSAEDSLSAITVTRDRIAFTPLPGAGMQYALARRVEFFATLAQEGDEASLAPAGKRLYEDLLAPALKGVPAHARTLIIAADGPLHGLPFDALGDTARVIDRWDVVMVPSASALANRGRRGRPTDAALVVAAPATLPNRPQLTAAAAEAAAIRNRVAGNVAELSGTSATKSRLESARPERFAVLHFASHALVDEERPLQSALLLASDGADDGRWSAGDIYRSKLRADLVVLSACSTAAGAEAAGEGVMSLSRAFLHAGAGATVATLWDVPDAPGPVFADVLYRELANGRPLGAAAADARRELRRLGAPPRAWAAYVLTGNPSAPVNISARTSPRLIAAQIAAVMAILLLLAAIATAFSFAALPADHWRPLATTAVIVAAVALTLQLWPVPNALAGNASLASRGDSDAALKPFLSSNGVVSWPAVKGADEHIVELFTAAGMPAGTASAQTSPFTIPRQANVYWVRIAARKDGAAIAESPLLRIPADLR